MIIYLHGLNSSALSEKGCLIAEYCGKHGIPCAVPTLHHRPVTAAAQIDALLQNSGTHTLVGSSMGGYYATWFCELNPALRAVLINPAVHLADKLVGYVGKEQTNYHRQERYIFSAEHLLELQTMAVTKPSHLERYWLMAQTGDEVLDYREAANFYQGARQTIEEGGDHSFVNFARHLPEIVAFS